MAGSTKKERSFILPATPNRGVHTKMVAWVLKHPGHPKILMVEEQSK